MSKREAKEKIIRMEETKRQVERIDAERQGLAVLKPKPKDFDNSKPILTENCPINEDEKRDYEISDLIVFSRWIIAKIRNDRDLDMFIALIKVQYLFASRNLTQLPKEFPENEMKSKSIIFEFTSKMPLKEDSLSNFISEYDLLVKHFKIESSISLEDGRPFIFEVDSLFIKKFNQFQFGMNFPPYDVVKEVDGSSTFAGLNNSFSPATAQIPELSKNLSSLSKITGLLDVPGYIGHIGGVGIPRLKRSTWISQVTIVDIREKWQEEQENFLNLKKDIDFELRLEYDQLLSEDLTLIVTTLKDRAKLYFEKPQNNFTKPKTKQISKESQYSKKCNEIFLSISPEEEQIFCNDSWNIHGYGVVIPEMEEDLALESDVLSSKKLMFGSILKSNQNTKVELDQSADFEGKPSKKLVEAFYL
ncbi:hypothetical protein HK096_002661 [Nowakowskiella sp. JEL0078]|nr:hypothetical protein HK096_002661 [Nowakowskiella sp. JEL0078]